MGMYKPHINNTARFASGTLKPFGKKRAIIGKRVALRRKADAWRHAG
jgi:hypothetical protein